MDLSKMQKGDIAGLGIFCSEPGMISVQDEGDKKIVIMTDRGLEKERVDCPQDSIFLKASCDFSTDTARFYYSFNRQQWKELGDEFRMVYNLNHFMGNRFILYNYATEKPGGYVDIDFFEYRNARD